MVGASRDTQHEDQDGSLSRGGTRHPVPAGHQGQSQGDAADRRQAADPVRGRRGAAGRRRKAGVRHRLGQAGDRGPFRPRPRARAGTRDQGPRAHAQYAARHRSFLRQLHLHPPGVSAGSRPRGAVLAPRGRRRAVLRAPGRRPHRRRGSLSRADGAGVRTVRRQRAGRADREARGNRQVRYRRGRCGG